MYSACNEIVKYYYRKISNIFRRLCFGMMVFNCQYIERQFFFFLINVASHCICFLTECKNQCTKKKKNISSMIEQTCKVFE